MRLTDAEWRKQKARIDKLIRKWVRPIGLGWWHIHFNFEDECEEDGDGSVVIGRCHVSWPYKEATITFFLNNIKDLDDDRVENLFVHELMHIIVNEMRDEVLQHNEPGDPEPSRDHEERACTDLARSFLYAATFVKSVPEKPEKKRNKR